MTARKAGKLGFTIKIVSLATWIPIVVGKILPPGIHSGGEAVDNILTQWFFGFTSMIYAGVVGFAIYLGIREFLRWWNDGNS